MRSLELAQHLADSGSQTTVASIYGLIGLVLVTLIGAAVTLLTARWNLRSPGSRSGERIAKHREALELWIALNTDADPRKIKTGFESPIEVARG